jgi:hypothetical protein
MAKVTYTKGQLMAFTVKEMKTLDLYSKIEPKGLNKEGIVKAMLSAQKAEQKALKEKEAKSEIKKETQPIAKEPVVETKEEVKEVVKEEVKEVDSSKPHFHRPIGKRNPMNFR